MTSSPTPLYPAWVFWTVLGVAALFAFSAWILNLFILAQVLVFVALLGGWRFVLWLKDNAGDSD